MNFRDDQRAVTVQVGSILLLGILVLSMSMYQAQVVPADNERVEFDHNQRVQQDMLDTRNAILRSAGTGALHPVSVSLGARYPNRVLFVNPPPASGRLSTTERVENGIVIENARAIDTETADYWTGEEPREFETRTLEYAPDYTRYQNPPTTVYEHSVLYNRFDNGATLPQSGQTLVDGRRISLVSLDGELSTARTGVTSLDVRPVSASTRTTTVTSDDEPIRLSVATGLSEDDWRKLLESEIEEGYVEDIDVTDGVLTITLEPGEAYSLRMAKVGVGSATSEEGPAYVTDVDGDGETVRAGTTQTLVAEVRDRFGNPVTGVDVTAAVTTGDGRLTFPEGSTTDDEGRVRVVYEAPEQSPQNENVEVDVGYGDAEAERAVFDLTVVAADGESTDGGESSGSAWQDTNNNGRRDSSESVDVSDGQFDNENVDLYVQDSDDIRTNTVDFNAKNVYVEPNITATASGNDEQISITAAEDVVISGTSLETTGSNANVYIKAGGEIDATGTIITTQNQGNISMKSGGSIAANNTELRASDKGEIRLDAGGSITIQSAIVDGDDGVTYTAGGAIDDSNTEYPGQTPTKSPNQAS